MRDKDFRFPLESTVQHFKRETVTEEERAEGIIPAYNMNKQNWITVFLDGTVPEERVYDLLDMSYRATASAKVKEKIRLLKRYDPEAFTFDVLKEDYGIYAVRGPRGVSYSLSQELR